MNKAMIEELAVAVMSAIREALPTASKDVTGLAHFCECVDSALGR